MQERGMKICFLVGSVAISGGTYVILQHAAHLRRQGHNVTLAIQEPFTRETLAWHDEAVGLECIPFADGQKIAYDVVIATWWKTALEIAAFKANHYAYFVQSIESRFYPPHERPLRQLVDRTYELPLSYSTEATWIQSHLREKYGQAAALVRNGIRKDVYSVDGVAVCGRDSSQQPRVLVEGHFGVPFKNTALAIQLAKQAGAKDVWLLTGSPVRWIPGVSRVFSKVSMKHTPAIYRSCDALIKLSTVEGMFGPPLEMFHCGGTALVFDVTGHEEYIRHNMNSLVAQTGDIAGVVKGIGSLLDDRRLLNRLKLGAVETAAAWPSWEHSSREFQRWIEESVVGVSSDVDRLRSMVATAWSEYGEAEGERLACSPWVRVGYRTSAIKAKLPSSVRNLLREGRMVWEVVGSKARVR
jgi:glycosyltransferase involved in cell wall biosynthesis